MRRISEQIKKSSSTIMDSSRLPKKELPIVSAIWSWIRSRAEFEPKRGIKKYERQKVNGRPFFIENQQVKSSQIKGDCFVWFPSLKPTMQLLVGISSFLSSLTSHIHVKRRHHIIIGNGLKHYIHCWPTYWIVYYISKEVEIKRHMKLGRSAVGRMNTIKKKILNQCVLPVKNEKVLI